MSTIHQIRQAPIAGVFALVLSCIASAAHADGFDCQAHNTGLRIHVANSTNPHLGTRTPEAMTVVNPLLKPDQQEIVKFTRENRTLTYLGRGSYLGSVDRRFLDSGRQGENIAGTKLGHLKSILLDIEFSYAHSDIELANSVKEVPAKIFYQKRT
ncbi:hypothetical protein EB061_12440, partial [bacterium]|nr:hypothetical protein [bacterium]